MITEKINNKDIEIYTWPNPKFPFYQFMKHDKCRIFIIENISHNFLWLKEVKNYILPSDRFFVLNGWYANRHISKLAKIVIEYLNLDKTQFIVMCNDHKELQNYLDCGFSESILLNHNAWLDETKYTITNEAKLYDAVLIARADKSKRLSLAKEIKKLALVTGQIKYNDDIVELPPHINNDNKRLSLQEIVEIINKSYCGLCLSAEEGACYSSSEYLLCGVPVVSTNSLGGRDVWYDEYNSIVCNADELSVFQSVNKIQSKTINREKIRNRHIYLSKYFRNVFIKKMTDIFHKLNITDVNVKEIYSSSYRNKLLSYSDNETIISEFIK